MGWLDLDRRTAETLNDCRQFSITLAMISTDIRFAEHAVIFSQNDRRDDQLKHVAFPKEENCGGSTGWRHVAADNDVCVDDDPHRLIRRLSGTLSTHASDRLGNDPLGLFFGQVDALSRRPHVVKQGLAL